MKKIFMLITIITAFHSFAESQTKLEFDETQEKNCYAEISAMKCTDTNGEEVSGCVESKKAKLTSDCKKLHETKMNLR